MGGLIPMIKKSRTNAPTLKQPASLSAYAGRPKRTKGCAIAQMTQAGGRFNEFHQGSYTMHSLHPNLCTNRWSRPCDIIYNRQVS